jgi:hypothetical protein
MSPTAINKGNFMSSFKTFSFTIASLIFIAACNQQTESNSNNTIAAATTTVPTDTSVISGVSSKGPISSALIEVYAFNVSDGSESGTPIAATTTNSNGRWSVSIPAANHTVALLIKSTGGSYLDESDPESDPSRKRIITFGTNDSILGALFPGFNTASVTMMTAALVEKSRTEAEGVNFLSVLNNNRNIATSALGFDPFTVASANPLAPSTAASVDSIEYAMYLGGMATALNSAAILMGKPVPDFSIVEGFIHDMADGRLDGSNQAGVVSVLINGTPTAFPTNINLNQAIVRFRNNNFSAYSVTPVTSVVTVNESMLSTSGVNSDPNALNDIVTTIENTPVVTPNLLANDTDPDGDSLTISGFSQPANGQVTNNNNGSFTYTPNTGFSGSDIFSYTVDDGHGGVDTAQVIITVSTTSTTNSNPIAVTDTVSTNQNVAATTPNLLANDSDPDGNPITISSFTQPTNGTVTNNNNGTFNYTPTNGFSGTDSFSYTISDGAGGTAVGTVNITVNAVSTNSNPFAVTDTASTNQNVAITTPNLLANDSDPDGNPITISNFTQPTNGTVTNNNDGTFNYTPTNGFSGVDTFTYTISDGAGGTAIGNVNINVINIGNIPPIANAGIDQSVNELININLSGSGTDSDGSISDYQWQQVGGTTVVINNSNSASASFTAPEVLVGGIDVLVFQLIVTDNESANTSDFITIIVNPVAIAPTANAGPDQTLNEGLAVSLDGTSSTDDRTIVAYAWLQIAGAPTITLTNGNTATPNFTGPDIANSTTFTFQLTVTDDEVGTDSDTVDINLISLNSGPTVVDDPSESTIEDTSVLISDLLANDSDPEGNTFTISSVTQPANGGVVIETGNTSVTYTPTLNFNGPDTFTYMAVDQFGAFSIGSAIVTVAVGAFNDSPVAITDSSNTIQGFPVTINDLLTNDTDPENDTLSITGVTQPANGVAVNNGDSTVTYTPDLAFNGADSFTYSIIDGNGGSDNGTVNITVIADTDGDGIIDTDEGPGGTGTDPNLADSDNDGFYDGHEILVGTDPNLINFFPPTTIISSVNANNVISSNKTWGLANSPYWLQTDVSVQNGATLTIEPGVVIKSSLGIDILVNSGGIINAFGNAPDPQHIVFSDARDDTINGDTNLDGVGTAAAGGGWSGIDFQTGSTGTLQHSIVRYGVDCIAISNSSPIISNTDIGECTSYGINITSSSSTHTSNLNDINVIDYDSNGTSTNFSAIRILAQGSVTNILNLSNLNIDEGGTSTNHGLFLSATSGGNISGSVDNLMITNASNDGLNISNNSSGAVNLTFSNVSINGAGGNGIDINNSSSGSIATSFDGTNTVLNTPLTNPAVTITNNDPDFLNSGSWTITNAGYGLSLSNSDGNFNNFTLDNTSIAGIRLGGSNPAQFTNVTLTNAPTPYEFNGQDIASITAINVGYDYSDPSVAKSHVRIGGGTLTANQTFAPDPLDAIATHGLVDPSVYRVISSITVPTGVTLTVDDGAIVKFDVGTSLIVNGSLTIGDGINGGAKAVLTSIRDDSVGGDTNANDGNATTPPASSDWNSIQVGLASNIVIDNAIIRYMDYGIYQNNINANTFSVSNTEITDFRLTGLRLYPNGTATYNLTNNMIRRGNSSCCGGVHGGLHLQAYIGDAVTLNIDGLILSDISGNSNDDRGLHLDINDTATLTGTINNVTASNITTGTAIQLDARTAGTVDLTFSNITINGAIGLYGLYLLGDDTLTHTPTLNGININAGIYNLLLHGVGGSYSNMNLDGPTGASILFSANTNPSVWDDSTVILTGSPSPFHLLTAFPGSVGTLGSTDLGFNQASSTATKSFMRVSGTLADTTLMADPLNTGSSVWRVPANITVPSGVTLTVTDGAVLKFDLGTFLFVDGTLSVTNAGGAKAVFTSIRDDSVGGDTNADSTGTTPTANDWQRIEARVNATIAIDNAIIRYMDYGIYQNNTNAAAFSISNTEITDFRLTGLRLYPNGTATYNLTDNMIRRGNSSCCGGAHGGLYLQAETGDAVTLNIDGLILSDISGNSSDDRGLYLDINDTATLTGTINNVTASNITTSTAIQLDARTAGAVDPTFSNITINGALALHGLYLLGDNTTIHTPTLNGININAGIYNLLLHGVGGSYSNMNLDGSTGAAIYFASNANPSAWDDNTITLIGGASPYHLVTAFPASIGTLGVGSIDLGFHLLNSTITNSFIRASGTITDLTLMADPLNTGSSVWRVPANITVPSGVTLTVTDGAVLKFDLGTFLFVDGTLSVTNAGGAKAVFTSIRDDSVGGDTNADSTGTTPTANDWQRIEARVNATIAIDNAIIRYMDYGIYQNNTNAAAFSISNTEITDFRLTGLRLYPNGTATYNLTDNMIRRGNSSCCGGAHGGLYLQAETGDAVTLNIDGLILSDISGNSSDDRGLYLDINDTATLTGTINNVTANNITTGTAIQLDARTAGTVDPTFSNITINGALGFYGIYLLGDNTLTHTPTLNGIDINAGIYNLLLSGVGGSYSNMNLDGATTSSIYFSDGANPSFFDGASIVLDNSPSPYTLIGQGIPSLVSFTDGSIGAFDQSYVILRGDLIENITLNADPFGTGNSVWYLPADLTVGSTFTLTVEAGAVVKASDGVDLFVDGTLDVTATFGNEAVFTDFKDDFYHGDSNGDGASSGTTPTSSNNTNNWQGISFRAGSLGTVDNLIVEYADIAVTVQNAGGTGGLNFNNLEINNSVDGLYVYSTSSSVTTAPTFNGLSVNECSSQFIYLNASTTTTGAFLQPVFSGDLSVTDMEGVAGFDGILTVNAGPNITLSGFTITGAQQNIDVATGSSLIVENNLLRNATSSGLSVRSANAPIIRNNIIVNNGDGVLNSGIDDAGIYASAGTNAFISNNIIRQNTGRFGAGIMIRASSPVIQNNLIVENADVSLDTFGGSGIYFDGTSSPTIINNTIANNTSLDTALGGGLSIRISGTATIMDNIIFGNTDGNSNANDVYYDGGGTIVENNNLIGAHNLTVPGLNDILATDPLFTNGWYLTVDALDGGGADSPAIDTGSDLAGNTASGAGTVVLSATTTRTDGADEGAGSQVDMGYHFPSGVAAPVVDTGLTTVSPISFDENPNTGGTIVVITVEPRNASNQVIGAGLIVTTSVTDANNIGSVTDLGDGSYEVSYTIPVGTNTDTVFFTVNGVDITANTIITWTSP